MNALKQMAVVLTTGYILMYFSEFVFYGEIASESGSYVPTLSEALILFCIYSVLGYILLALIKEFRVRNLWALFLVGAAYGWLLEGVVVTTMYEGFPMQIHFTGIAWHAPLDVLLGWYLIQKVLRIRNPMKTLGIASALGLFCGLWVIWRWWEEGIAVPIERFAALTSVGTFLLVFAYWLLGRSQLATFQPGKWINRVVAILLLLWFIIAVLPVYPFAILVLPPLLFIIYLGLRKNKANEILPDLLHSLEDRPRGLNLALLLLIPILATVSYSLYLEAGLRIPMSAIGYTFFSILGIVLFIIGAIKTLKQKSSARAI